MSYPAGEVKVMRFIKKPFIVLKLPALPWKWVLYLVLALLLVYGNIAIYEELSRPPAREAVLQGLSKSLNSSSCRYQAVAKRVKEGKESVLSEIWGEKNSQGVHLKGNLPIIKAEIEVYHLGDKIYRRDPFTQGWLVVSSQGRASVEQLIAEVNPLGIFKFPDNPDVKYTGKEKVGKTACRVYEIMTRGENKYLELYWQDFNYRLWIDKKDGLIRKAEVSAEHRDDSTHILTVIIELMDYNEPVEIKPPLTQ